MESVYLFVVFFDAAEVPFIMEPWYPLELTNATLEDCVSRLEMARDYILTNFPGVPKFDIGCETADGWENFFSKLIEAYPGIAK